MLLGTVPKHSRVAGCPAKLRRALQIGSAGRRFVGTCRWIQVLEDMARAEHLKEMSVPPSERRTLETQPLEGLRRGC